MIPGEENFPPSNIARAKKRIAAARRADRETLDLSDLGLTDLSGLDLYLPGLRVLDLSFNRLESLPPEFEQMRDLQCLDLTANNLGALPELLRRLPRLERIFLHGNPRLDVPDEVLGPDFASDLSGLSPAKAAREVLDYYFATVDGKGKPLREVKLIVVGRGGVGKTSLVKRLRGEIFNREESESHGITINPLTLDCSDGPISARVWDFGGQVVLHAMHEFFLTARSLYLLVLVEREDMAERDAVYWLQLIRSYAGPTAPIVVVLNKSGGGQMREMDRRALEAKYGPIHHAWIETECADPDPARSGIAKLKATLAEVTDGMSEVRRLFPSKWFAIKDWLSRMPDAYLDYAAFAQRCAGLGESDPEKQEELAAWLHDLGIALNYGRDPRLRDLTVLRPDWLANGIYTILRAYRPADEGASGVIHYRMLGGIYRAAAERGILDAADYPEEKWLFLLRLMSRFQLSFPLGDSDNEREQEHLVPALLPVEEPVEAAEPAGENRICVRFAFDVIPAPLMPRLLVRVFSLIHDRLLWRRGAILAYGPAAAKLWCTPDQRYIHAAVSAPPEETEARDDLLVILRRTLREIVREYQRLPMMEEVLWQGHWVPRDALEDLDVIEKDEPEDEPPPPTATQP